MTLLDQSTSAAPNDPAGSSLSGVVLDEAVDRVVDDVVDDVVELADASLAWHTRLRHVLSDGRVIKTFVMLSMVALLVVSFFALRSYIADAFGAVSHPSLPWVGVAVAAELVSMSSFTFVQRAMLRVGGLRVPTWKLTSVTYAANAMSVTLPAGSAIATGYTFRRFRRWGATTSLATFVMVAGGVLSGVAFVLVALVAGAVDGVQDGSPGEVIVAGIGGLALVIVVPVLVRHGAAMLRVGDALLRVGNRLRRKEPTAGRDRIIAIAQELRHIQPRRRDWAGGLGYSMLNWVADLVCLLAACKAVGLSGATVGLVLIAYVAGISVANFSVLPGGFGVVDTAMILALSQGGADPIGATAGVLLYRIISVVFIVVVGWVMWSVWWAVDRRRPVLAESEDVAGDVLVAQPIVSGPIVSGSVVSEPVVSGPIVSGPVSTDLIPSEPIVVVPTHPYLPVTVRHAATVLDRAAQAAARRSHIPATRTGSRPVPARPVGLRRRDEPCVDC